jgi:polyisoprenoid-binding protein YceI
MNQLNFSTAAKSTRRIVLTLAAGAAFAFLGACATDGDSKMAAKSANPSNWAVDTGKSSLTFVTTKAGQAGVGGIGEVQTFKRFSGGLDTAGQIKLVIDLASVDTGVEIRDERMRTMLWNVKATPSATFTAKLSPENMTQLGSNASTDLDVAGSLELAGQTKPVTAKLRASRTADGMMVVTRAPIVVNSNDYGLKAGVEAMREVMGLNFLASTAPVSFALVLGPAK